MFRIYVISSVVPDGKGFGGPLVLYRYLKSPDLEVKVFKWNKFPLRLKIIGKLKQLGLKWPSRMIETLWPVLPDDSQIDAEIQAFRPDVILTVAHGWLHLAACAASERNRLPLISFYQDWWPEFEDIPKLLRARTERLIRQTAARSTKVICVSQGMVEELGSPTNAVLIHDLPSLVAAPGDRTFGSKPFRLIYFGNLSQYGPMVESALRACGGRGDLELHVYGPTPQWPPGAEAYFRESGRYHGTVSSAQLTELIPQFDGILVTMLFDPGFRRRMSTSFLSKLIEGVQHGLPIVIWGPENCSAVKWAKPEDKAVCVTSEDPEALVKALGQLAEAGSESIKHYAEKAREAAANEFNPDLISQRFRQVLAECKSRRA